MSALEKAKSEAARFEESSNPAQADRKCSSAMMYAAIAQAEVLRDILQELARISNSDSLISSLQAEIVLDMRNRRAAERASYLAYHRAYAEAEEECSTVGKNILPEETLA